ncbi:inner-membrane translocator [Clostridia bacterium]|nr:inner-membrane translocator [Clostridia bacterium]
MATINNAIKKQISLLMSNKAQWIPFAGLVIIIVIFEVLSGGKLFAERNHRILIYEAFTLVMGASALTFVMSQGKVDLSTGGIVALCCAAGATVSNGGSPWLCIPVALGTGLLIGLLNGLVAAHLKIDSFIATIAMSFMMKGVVVQILDSGSIGIPLKMLGWDSVALRVVTLVIVCVVSFLFFEYGKIGKWSRAVGSNEIAAYQSGVNVRKIRITGFLITGAMAGAIAIFSILRTGTASTSSGANYEMDTMIALLLGGMPITGGPASRYYAAVVGGLTMTFLSNGMTVTGIDAYVQQLIRGIIFLFAVAMTFNRKSLAYIK